MNDHKRLTLDVLKYRAAEMAARDNPDLLAAASEAREKAERDLVAFLSAPPAATERPEAPDCCEHWPFCGRDVTGRCGNAAKPTVPAPEDRPDQARALANLMHQRDAVNADIARADATMSTEDIERAVEMYHREKGAR